MKKNRASSFSALAYTKRDKDIAEELENLSNHYGVSKVQVLRELVYQFGYKINIDDMKNRILRKKIQKDPEIQMMIERGLLKVA